jgi:hypothetical protein
MTPTLSDIAPPITRHTLSTGQGWRLRHRPLRWRAGPRETLVADADDCHDTYICHRCVGDSFLKQEIRRDGRKQECHFSIFYGAAEADTCIAEARGVISVDEAASRPMFAKLSGCARNGASGRAPFVAGG